MVCDIVFEELCKKIYYGVSFFRRALKKVKIFDEVKFCWCFKVFEDVDKFKCVLYVMCNVDIDVLVW